MGATGPPRRAAVRIARLAAGGDGVGRLADGLTVFVPRTAPGDVVTLRMIGRRKGFARAQVDELLESGPDRVAPPCSHYERDRCGGCQLQHLAAPAQREARRRIVGDAMRRIGKVRIDDPPLEPAPDDWAYRSRLSLHAVGDRIGLRPMDRPDDAFDLDRCHIAEPALQQLWTALQPFRALLPRQLERLTLRLDGGGGLHVMAGLPRRSEWDRAGDFAAALATQGLAVTLWVMNAGAAAQCIEGNGDGAPAGSFEQVNRIMGSRVRQQAVSQLGALAGEQVWDLYAGIGETTTLLVELGATVSSVELDEQAVRWAAHHGPPARRIVGRVELSLATLPLPARVIVNPPRTGMHADAVSQIVAAGPRRIVYISCDPATLARDVARFSPYRLVGLRAYDLFPQTAHVESVAVMER